MKLVLLELKKYGRPLLDNHIKDSLKYLQLLLFSINGGVSHLFLFLFLSCLYSYTRV